MLNIFELREEICQFLQSKGKDTAIYSVVKSGYATCHLNVQLQGRGCMIVIDMYDAVKAFQVKLRLRGAQMQLVSLFLLPDSVQPTLCHDIPKSTLR